MSQDLSQMARVMRECTAPCCCNAAGADEEPDTCTECGDPMFIDDNGISHHGTNEDDIDYDADGDHVAVSEREFDNVIKSCPPKRP